MAAAIVVARRRSSGAAACGQSSAPAAGTAGGQARTEDRHDREELDQPGLPRPRAPAPKRPPRSCRHKNGVPIEIAWLTPPTEDGQVQAQRIAQAVNEGANAILISCSDAGKVTGAINDAVARGVPVMTFDSDAPESKRFAFYGVDDLKTGEEVMDELAKQMGGKGNVAHPGRQPERAEPAQARRRRQAGGGEVPEHQDRRHLLPHRDAAGRGGRSHPRAERLSGDQGWAMIGGWPLFTQTLLTDLDPKKIKIVAVDALPAELAYVEKGLAPVLLAQPSYLWGYVGVQKIFDKVAVQEGRAADHPDGSRAA